MSLPYTYPLYSTSESEFGMETRQVKGVLTLTGKELLFEFKVYDMLGNAISSLSKFSIDVEQIRRSQFKKGFFQGKGKLIIEAKQEAYFEPLPGSSQGMIKLDIIKANKNRAIDFTAQLNHHITEKRLNEI